MEIADGPGIVSKPAFHYVGIRVITPFRGIPAVRDELMSELHAWLDERAMSDAGPAFHRLHVIDMDGPMDMEVGVVVEASPTGDNRVRAGALPAGRYASLTYVNHARRANRLLLDWARDNGHALERVGRGGRRFASRAVRGVPHRPADRADEDEVAGAVEHPRRGYTASGVEVAITWMEHPEARVRLPECVAFDEDITPMGVEPRAPGLAARAVADFRTGPTHTRPLPAAFTGHPPLAGPITLVTAEAGLFRPVAGPRERSPEPPAR